MVAATEPLLLLSPSTLELVKVAVSKELRMMAVAMVMLKEIGVQQTVRVLITSTAGMSKDNNYRGCSNFPPTSFMKSLTD